LRCLCAERERGKDTAAVHDAASGNLSFHEKLPRIFPHKDVRQMFDGNSALIASTALRNSSLQGA